MKTLIISLLAIMCLALTALAQKKVTGNEETKNATKIEGGIFKGENVELAEKDNAKQTQEENFANINNKKKSHVEAGVTATESAKDATKEDVTNTAKNGMSATAEKAEKVCKGKKTGKSGRAAIDRNGVSRDVWGKLL